MYYIYYMYMPLRLLFFKASKALALYVPKDFRIDLCTVNSALAEARWPDDPEAFAFQSSLN